MHEIVERNEKPHDGMLRVQVHRVICSCGWMSSWQMDVNGPDEEFGQHLKAHGGTEHSHV